MICMSNSHDKRRCYRRQPNKVNGYSDLPSASASAWRAPRSTISRRMPPLIFRKGLDLKDAVAGELAASYHSPLVAQIKEGGYSYDAGRLTVHLAREFGFCYGVDRAVDYAYQARTR